MTIAKETVAMETGLGNSGCGEGRIIEGDYRGELGGDGPVRTMLVNIAIVS